MEHLSQTVRQTVSPNELQIWASQVISNTPRERLFGALPKDGAPKGIQQLVNESSSLELGMDGSSNDIVVIFTRGGGFGHWGFAVGSTTYACKFGRVQSHWTNGIWFWHE